MKKIGIDAKWYLNGNPSGKVVVRNIVNEIVKINQSCVIYLFMHNRDQKNQDEILDGLKYVNNVKLIFIPTCINFLSNMIIMPYYAKKLKIDVCLYQNFTPIVFRGRVKNIVYIHDFLFFDFPEFYSLIECKVFRLMRFTARYANSIITISNSEKKRIYRHLRIKKRIDVVYHGVSDEFKPVSQENISLIRKKYELPDKFILYLGRINVRKNIRTILEAMPFLARNYSLVIVGKKDHKSFDIEREIERLELQERVKLLGHVNYTDLLKIIGTSQLFVFPSFAEGFGLPPLEAMKAGVPTVISNATCLPEVCGNASLYFDPNNVEELITQINSLLVSKGRRDYYINKGLIHSTQFNWEKTARQILSILTDKYIV